MKVDMIVAVSNNMAIGLPDGSLPWHVPEDLAWFASVTANRSIIMGRKTWESLPKKPLPNRQNIVLTHRRIRGVDCATSMEEAISIARNQPIVIGGANVYEQAMPFVHTLYLSMIPVDVPEPCVKFPFGARDWYVENKVTKLTHTVLTLRPAHHTRDNIGLGIKLL